MSYWCWFRYYKRAIAADPSHTNNCGNYALFLAEVRKEYDTAEKYYQQALDADPKHANSLYNYAVLMDRYICTTSFIMCSVLYKYHCIPTMVT